MSRPKKWRKVCCLPNSDRFGPLNSMKHENQTILMTVEEYETIRLIDLEGLTQEECAIRMGVARTTVQAIYTNAREKLADLIVNGKVLHIEGGDFRVCDGLEQNCKGKGCHKKSVKDME